jgi:hypothetical protein
MNIWKLGHRKIKAQPEALQLTTEEFELKNPEALRCPTGKKIGRPPSRMLFRILS